MYKISFLFGSIILILLCSSPEGLFSQNKLEESDTITIYHKYYSTTFSKSKHFPVVVKYWLTRSMLDCGHRYKRSNKFKPDPLIPEFTNIDKDYTKSGYDRGHQMDAYECGCDSTAMAESFYYSNIAPQLPALNRGNWNKLEEYTRKFAKEYDSVLVLCGSVTIEERHIGKVAVPDYCWKIIYIKRLGIVKAYAFRNEMSFKQELHSFEVSVDSIRSLAGFVFNRHFSYYNALTGFMSVTLFAPPSPPLRGGLFGGNEIFLHPHLITFFIFSGYSIFFASLSLPF
jgi:DNA/RNA endonuclease G (NUC1)